MLTKASIEIYHPQGLSLFPSHTELRQLATGFKFAEAPLWHPDRYVLMSDVPANRIFLISLTGVIHVLLQYSGGPKIIHTHLSDMIGSNGLALDNNNDLLFCQHGSHAIAKMDKSKNIISLCFGFNGKPFNSPNDIVIHSSGAVYFTDPPYGLKNQVLNPALFQTASGVYKYHNNKVTLLTTELNFPNGVCFSRDEKNLFVSSNHPEEKKILKYLVGKDGQLKEKTLFAAVNADGIKTDIQNNLFAATNEGVVIFSPAGEKIALIEMPEMVTNLAFGGNDNDSLFITTPSSLYQLRLVREKNENPDGKKMHTAAVRFQINNNQHYEKRFHTRK